MKKTLSMITLAVLTVGLLGSCAKINERLDNLEKKVDGLENEEIATIDSQIASINSSISDLESLRQKVQAMSDPATGLDKRIKELEAFVSDVKKNYATKEWAKITLVTMEEYEKTCDTVAKIAAKVEGFDSDIKACADSLKGWVNGKFGGYYDIAEIDAKLAELQEQVDGVDSLRAELAKTRTEIDTAKSAIRAEYRAVIETAIKTSEGKLTKALQDSIDNVNATIGTLTGRVGILETKVDALKGRIDSLENMIQTVTIVPAYSDGSVKVEDDTLSIDCVITPAEAVKALDTADFTILLNKVRTKAVVLDTVPTDSIKVFTKDTLNGTVSIKAYIKETLAELEDNYSLAVAVNVKKDKSDFTTEFVPVYVAGPDIPEGALSGVFSVSATKKVHFSKGNLQATYNSSATTYTWGFAANQYDCIGNAAGNTTIDSQTNGAVVDLFGWVGASSTAFTSSPEIYGVSTSITNSDYGNVAGEALKDDWGKAVGDGNTWSTLTKDEWAYLFNTRTVNGGKGAGKSYSLNITYGGKMGVVLYPDDYTGSVLSGTVDSLPEGVVFLPAAGNCDDHGVNSVGESGGYWSSTASDEDHAYSVGFDAGEVAPNSQGERYLGYSVRLVTDVSAAPAPTEPDFVVMKMGSGQSKTLKWRKMNLGATTVAGNPSTCYGNLYSWGNPTGSDGDNITSPGFTSGNYQGPGKSISKAGDWVMATHDAAYKELGGKWRMPTSQEFKDLADACGGSDNYDSETYESPAICGEATTFDRGIYWCDSYDGVAGCLFCDGTNKLFIPAAGFGNGTSLYDAGSDGLYWSSTWYSSANAYSLYFNSVNVIPQDDNIRYNGFPVRPVSD